jgi:hypothetical protein
MRPAFTSTKAAAAFGLLLLVVLLSPVLAGKKFLPPREQAYAGKSWGSGPFPWIQNQIFEETNAIDIAFMGSSHILHAVDTPYVQEQLGKKLGRPAVARTIGWGGAGYDALYFIAKDLLEHRQVRLLVIYDENPGGERNAQIPALFRFCDDVNTLAGLPLTDQSVYYCAATLGMPKNLLAKLRPNLPAPLVTSPPNYWERHYGSASIVKLLGCTRSELGFNYDRLSDHFTAFTPFVPRTLATSADVEVYAAGTKTSYDFTHEPLPAWQVHFARKLGELAHAHQCRLVVLNLPVLADAPQKTIRERACWPEVFQADLAMLGIPPAKLFDGLTDEKLHWLFTNSSHFNANGMDYFTPLITPALLEVFGGAANRRF